MPVQRLGLAERGAGRGGQGVAGKRFGRPTWTARLGGARKRSGAARGLRARRGERGGQCDDGDRAGVASSRGAGGLHRPAFCHRRGPVRARWWVFSGSPARPSRKGVASDRSGALRPIPGSRRSRIGGRSPPPGGEPSEPRAAPEDRRARIARTALSAVPSRPVGDRDLRRFADRERFAATRRHEV